MSNFKTELKALVRIVWAFTEVLVFLSLAWVVIVSWVVVFA
jgi:hypothetical protein